MPGLRLGYERSSAGGLVRRDGHLIELGAVVLLAFVFLSLALPLALVSGVGQTDLEPIDRLLDACQQGLVRGPMAIIGYSAGAILVVWATLVLLRLFWHVAWDLPSILLQGRRLTKQATIVECSVDGRPLTVYVLASDRVLAFTAGLFRPQIFVSSTLLRELSPAELQATLLHEVGHASGRDPLRCWTVGLLLPAAYFPRTAWLVVAHRAARESRADTYAISRLGVDRPLIQALHKVDSLVLKLGACGLISDRQRALRQLRTDGKPVSPCDRIALLVGLSVVVVFMSLAVMGLGDWQSYWFCPDDPTMLVSR